MSSMDEWMEACRELDVSDEEEEVSDERKHDKLLDAIGAMDGKKKSQIRQRTEVASEASVFHVSSGTGKVGLGDLVGALSSKLGHTTLKKQLNRVQHNQKVLDTPLSKLEKERVTRTIAYEETRKEVSKWDPVVAKNRKAENMEFPLQKPDLRLITTDKFVKRFQVRTPLEVEVAALLSGNKNTITENRALTKAEEKALKAMSLEEARERRAELQKHRALLSYKEAKARRVKKIKSKKYHRILRKEREKNEKHVMDELQHADPEAFLAKLHNIDRDRIQERMSLKHRGASKQMKKQAIFGKYDDNARQMVQDMIQKSQELTQKVATAGEDTSEESEEEVEGVKILGADPTTTGGSLNPWMSAQPNRRVYARLEPMVNEESVLGKEEGDRLGMGRKEGEVDTAEEVGEQSRSRDDRLEERQDDSVKSDQNQSKNKATSVGKRTSVEASDGEDLGRDTGAKNVDIDELFDSMEKKKVSGKEQKVKKLTGKKKNKPKPKAKESSSESEEESDSESEHEDSQKVLEFDHSNIGVSLISTSLTRKKTLEDYESNWSDKETDEQTKRMAGEEAPAKQDERSTSKKKGEIHVDPQKFMTVEKTIKSSARPDIVVEAADNIDEEEHRMTLADAFAADDVIDEFVAEKKDRVQKDKPKDVNLALPGWGDWGGEGVQITKRKRKRFTLRAPKAAPRMDRNLDNVIISETKDNSIAKHQVSELPFPYKNIHQFEATVRQPIGKTWNPETAYRKMIQPKISTARGTIIDPISKTETFKNLKRKGGMVEEGKGRKKGKDVSEKGKKGKANGKKRKK